MATFTIEPTGPFSLRESVEFGFGQRHSQRFDGTMRLAFVLDGYERAVGVEVTQDDAGVHGRIVAPSDADVQAVRRQVARVLSLDQDGAAFAALGRRDPVIGRLQEVAPGLLPPLFYSPYEAAIWSVLSARRPARQMADVRDRLSVQYGTEFDLGGQRMAALPSPRQLLAVTAFPGIPDEKLQRMHAIARAALAGRLDVARLQRLTPETVVDEMQEFKGIGPFYASLIAIRAVGFTDILPIDEKTGRAVVSQLYGFAEAMTDAQYRELSESWRPFRTWAVVLIRAAWSRLPEFAPATA